MISSMAFFCADEPSPFRVPLGHSAPAEDALADGEDPELLDSGSLPHALSVRRPATEIRTAALRMERRLLTDTA
jgi:hypothetical protein